MCVGWIKYMNKTYKAGSVNLLSKHDSSVYKGLWYHKSVYEWNGDTNSN